MSDRMRQPEGYLTKYRAESRPDPAVFQADIPAKKTGFSEEKPDQEPVQDQSAAWMEEATAPHTMSAPSADSGAMVISRMYPFSVAKATFRVSLSGTW